ncbi:MAG: hypothetical protein K9J17_16170 [Flavobacteriales bacterium]|nr:hypothetical protein [Flavobacteriales bacterium]
MKTNLSHWRPAQRGFSKICPVDGAEFIGRKNKVFCSIACKNRHHNDANAELRAHERELSSILIKNERVLRELMRDHATEGAKQVTSEMLDLIGFDQKGPFIAIQSGDGTRWFQVGAFVYRYLPDKQTYLVQRLN